MSLLSDIQAAVKSGMNALDDVRELVTYRSAGTPTYDAASGAPLVTTTEVPVRAVFVHYRRDEIDGQVIRPEDQQCLIAAEDLSMTPALNDSIVRGSETWSVVGIQTDPAKAVWLLQVRRP